MKKYIYASLAALTASFGFTACEEEAGTTPGSDSQPVVSVYGFTPEAPYDTDTDLKVRVAANNKADEVYYLAEKSAEVESYISSKGSEAYYEKVMAEGKRVDVAPAAIADIYVTGMQGQNTITFVAANGGSKTSATISFFGMTWNTLSTGTYYFAKPKPFGMESANTTLQVNGDDPTEFRLKNLYGEGSHLIIKTIDIRDTDSYGAYTYARIPAQATPFTYGSYGTVSVRDLGYWQGDDAYVTEYGYHGRLYDDHSYIRLYIQDFVSAGSLGYGVAEYVAD